MAIESLPGQMDLFAEQDDAGAEFRLSDANVELLREVSELPDDAVRPLLFLALVLLFAQGAAESVEAADPAAEQIAWRSKLLPLRWLRRQAMFL